jgi:CheY-like chemotaxis protein
MPPPIPIRCHVLVVDDNAVNRRILTALLEKLGCRVDTARNGREAVDAVLGQRYSVVFMDCQMPVLNGYEATAEIRRHSLPVSDVPICGVSASMDIDTQSRCVSSGMDEFMSKPVTLDMLRDLLTRVAARQIIEENLRQGG